MNNTAFMNGELVEAKYVHAIKFNWKIAIVLKCEDENLMELIANHFHVDPLGIKDIDDLADFMVIKGFLMWVLSKQNQDVWVLKHS